MTDHAVNQLLAGVARALDAAGHGHRGPIVAEACAGLGWQPQRLYRELRARVGWVSGRGARADKGQTRQSMETLKAVAAMQRETVRKNGKQILRMPVATAIAVQNGYQVQVSTAHLARLMRQRHMSAEQLARDVPVTELKSLHPNHVHQADPSLCVLYYLGGRQRLMQADRFYKNKLDNYARVKMKVWRYVLTDHASSSIIVRYYEAAGENPLTLFEFLLYAWGRQPQRPQHGAPRVLMMDKGSANTASAVVAFLEDLEVEVITHAPGQARVKGQVEGAQNIIETHFESRLALEPVDNVGQLNDRAEDWSRAWNANAIPHQDTRLKRGPVMAARTDLWLTIREEQLRILPPAPICRAALAGREETRKVNTHLRVQYKHPAAETSREYPVDGLAGVNVGDIVRIRPLLFGDCVVKVKVSRYDGADLVYRVEPLAAYDQFGFSDRAATIGAEYRATKTTEIERQAAQADQVARPGKTADEIDRGRDKHERPSFGRGADRDGRTGGLDAHSHLADVRTATTIPKRGTEIAAPADALAAVARLSVTQIAMRLARELERPLSEIEWAWLGREVGPGIPEHEAEALIARFGRRASFSIVHGGQA
jgi:hypothetical protein